jgi:hypothetical protein
MQENSFLFTDTINQVKTVRDHNLSSLTLTEEDIEDCSEELDKNIRYFLMNTVSKYKANHRVFENFMAKIFSKKKENFFEVSPSVLDKRFKKFPTESAHHKKEAEREEIAPAT